MKYYKIKRGLNIKLKGKAEEVIDNEIIVSNKYIISPEVFYGFEQKLAVQVGDIVKRADVLLYDKNFPEIKLTSPVCGTIIEINRGEKRKITEIIIEKATNDDYINFIDNQDINNSEVIKNILLNSGCWLYIKQRPFGIIANPTKKPNAIFISFFDSATLAPNFDFILKDKKNEINKALQILKNLSDCKIYLSFNKNSYLINLIENQENYEINFFDGPHPSGLVGTHINKIRAIGKNDIYWTISAADLPIIGNLFLSGEFLPERLIAVCGSEIKNPCYYKTIANISLLDFLKDKIKNQNVRIISGNVLTGQDVSEKPHLDFFDNMLTVIPEGNKEEELFGWLLPGLNKLSNSRTFLSNYYPILNILKSAGNDNDRLQDEYSATTNTHGDQRAFIMSGEYEKVCPLDIYPQMLVKAAITEDIEKMEQLGIYEVIEEDLALCEFVCTSKINVQEFIRKGINQVIAEI